MFHRVLLFAFLLGIGQIQSDDVTESKNIFSDLFAQYTDLVTILVQSVFQNKQINLQCVNKFQVPSDLPEEIQINMNKCTDQISESVMARVPKEILKLIEDIRDGQMKLETLIDVIQVIYNAQVINKKIQEASEDDSMVLDEVLKCVKPMFAHVMEAFNKNLESFKVCISS